VIKRGYRHKGWCDIMLLWGNIVINMILKVLLRKGYGKTFMNSKTTHLKLEYHYIKSVPN
jgi:hypothetical protein